MKGTFNLGNLIILRRGRQTIRLNHTAAAASANAPAGVPNVLGVLNVR